LPKLTELSVGINVPGFLKLEGKWRPDEVERTAAWEMYVELITRVALNARGPQEGSVRDALDSLYSLFGTTREILRRHGPGVARRKIGEQLSFGHLAVAVLGALRPFLTRWNAQLRSYEALSPPGVSATVHELNWPLRGAFEAELGQLQRVLGGYAALLAEAAGVAPLHDAPG
jgi:hypothetical protein